jgi:UDP-glucose 4-epimerase
MSILVTGGLGYIGSHVVINLLESNVEENIVIFDNLSNSSNDILKGFNEYKQKVDFVEGDLCSDSNIQNLFECYTFSTVIHLAAYKSVEQSILNPLLYYENNLKGLLNLLSYCRIKKVRRFIFSSSCTVYGLDNDGTIVTEDTPFGIPANPYARTKQMGENILAECDFMQIISLRYFNPVGAHNSLRFGEKLTPSTTTLFPNVCSAIVNNKSLNVFGIDYNTKDGTCVRDFIHVEDVASAHTLSLTYMKFNSFKYDVFNIGSGDGYSILEVLKEFELQLGRKVKYDIKDRRIGDIAFIIASYKKSRNLLGWEPKHSLSEMVLSTLKWYRVI